LLFLHIATPSPLYRHLTKYKYKKTTRRWFHDTAYCFDFILIFPMVPGAGLEPAQRERRGILKTINHHL
ncbi:hypothetical protein, partial [Escherichia coli]|uniref:hypothetical protein n=1 Tax=Escherichia coli TaxID=562 RepID=UPI001BDD1696